MLSKSGGVELNRLEADYKMFVNTPLPYRGLGFSSVESFLQAMPDVAQYDFN